MNCDLCGNANNLCDLYHYTDHSISGLDGSKGMFADGFDTAVYCFVCFEIVESLYSSIGLDFPVVELTYSGEFAGEM